MFGAPSYALVSSELCWGKDIVAYTKKVLVLTMLSYMIERKLPFSVIIKMSCYQHAEKGTYIFSEFQASKNKLS